MRTTEDIENRIRFLLTEELKTRVTMASTRLPHLCTHNHRQPLDVRKNINDEANELYNRVTYGPRLPVLQTMGLCMLDADKPEEWNGTLCEDPIDAQRCPYFNPKLGDKKALWALFSAQVSDPEWLQENMPEVYGLLWSVEASTVPGIPWWKRIWYRLLRIQVDPVRIVEDPARLLPPP